MYSNNTTTKTHLQWQEASKEYNCPLCNKPDWCYLGFDEDSRIEMTFCGRTELAPNGWVRFGTDPQNRGKYRRESPYRDDDRREKTQRTETHQQYIHTDVDGNPLIRVNIKWKNGEKQKPWQEYYVKGQWLTPKQAKKKGIEFDKSQYQSQLALYNWSNVKSAIAKNEAVFIVEGEPCVHVLEQLGITATTNLMGSGYWKQQYTQQLQQAGIKTVTISPDRDQVGIKHAYQIADRLQAAGIEVNWLYPYPNSPLWNHLPESKGLDIKDFLDDNPNMSQDDLFNRIELERRQLEINYKESQPSQQNENQTELEHQQQIEIKSEIQRLINDGVTGSDLEASINDLAIKSKSQPRQLWNIYHRCLEESERDVALGDRALWAHHEEAKAETLNLLNLSKTSIKLEDIIDSKLAKPLSQIAKMMGSKDEAIITSLLPIVASLIPTTSKLELIRSTRYYAKPVVYTGIVGESGSVKSPTQKLVLNALFQLQNELNKEYERRLQEWEEMEVEDGEKKPPKPVPIDLWTSDATSEKVAEMLAKQEDEKQGFVIWKDELSALIKDNNAYRGGHGSDAEKLLSGRDGSPLKVDRVSKRFSVSQSSYSITGGIQPDTLKQQIDFSDPTGHWARFLFCYLPLTKQTFPEDELDIDIDDYLKSVYERLRGQSPQTYVMSASAKELYKQWFNKLGELAYGESRQGLRNVYSKMKGDTGVIALLLHCLNAAIRGEQPEQEISESTMKSAIALTKYYIGQVKLIHAEGDAEDGELSPLYIKILNLSDRKGWIKARDVKNNDRSFKKYNANDIRGFFSELETMGLGQTSGKGNQLSFTKAVDAVDACRQSVDGSVYKPESSNHGDNHINQSLVDGLTTFSDDNLETNSNGDQNNLVDSSVGGNVYRVYNNHQTGSNSESGVVDRVSTSRLQDDEPSTSNREVSTSDTNHPEPEDRTIPIREGDIIEYRHPIKLQTVSREVKAVKQQEKPLSLGSNQKKIVETVTLSNGEIFDSDHNDVLGIYSQWGEVKWKPDQ